jgi:hypothetical protein
LNANKPLDDDFSLLKINIPWNQSNLLD